MSRKQIIGINILSFEILHLHFCKSLSIMRELSNIKTHNPLTMLEHQLWQSVDGIHSNHPLLVPVLSIQVTENGRYEGIIKAGPSVADSQLRLRLLQLMMVMLLVMEMINLMKV